MAEANGGRRLLCRRSAVAPAAARRTFCRRVVAASSETQTKEQQEKAQERSRRVFQPLSRELVLDLDAALTRFWRLWTGRVTNTSSDVLEAAWAVEGLLKLR